MDLFVTAVCCYSKLTLTVVSHVENRGGILLLVLLLLSYYC